jgi:ABC-type transporter Mla subunit MlaD
MNKDKVIGFATIALALLLVVYVAFAMWQREKRAQNTIYVQFDEMGALQNEDIVTIRGFEVGRIAAITRVRGKALVEIDFDEPRSFRKDTKFKNISPNIMGSRNIAIEPGAKGEFAPKDYVFDGEFEAGMAEILYLTDVAKEQVAIVMELVRLLHSGDEENSPFHSKFEDALTGIEELIAVLSRTVEAVESKALSALNTVGNYAVQISDASAKVGNSLDTIRLQARDGILAADKIVEKVNNSIANLNEAILQFESNSVTVALLDKKDIMNDLDSLSNALKSFVNAIDHKGIKIYDEKGKRKSMVTLKNLHLIRETARSKAKKRAAQEAREAAQ